MTQREAAKELGAFVHWRACRPSPDLMLHRLEVDHETAVKRQKAAIARTKADIADCEKQTDLLLDMRLNEQISETEYVSKKQILVNRKAELRGKLEALEDNRSKRFEPAIAFVKALKNTSFLLAEGKPEEKRDFLKKIGSNL